MCPERGLGPDVVVTAVHRATPGGVSVGTGVAEVLTPGDDAAADAVGSVRPGVDEGDPEDEGAGDSRLADGSIRTTIAATATTTMSATRTAGERRGRTDRDMGPILDGLTAR